MSSIREIAEQLVQRWEGNNPIDTADAADLAGAIGQALRDRDERAAKICDAAAMLASPDGVIPKGDPEHERLQRLSEVLKKAAAAIRED